MNAPASPPRLNDLKAASMNLSSLLNGFKMGVIMKVAHDSSPKPRTELVTARVENYIHQWLVGPENVGNVSEQWAGQITTAFRTSYDDCQVQVDRVKNNWTGEAADSFSTQATALLTRLNNSVSAVNGISTTLADLSANLGKLRVNVITQAAEAAITMVNAAIQVGNTAIQNVDPKLFVEAATGIGAPFAVVQYCMSIVAQISQQLTSVVGKLDALVVTVNNSLQDMRSSATKMESNLSANLSKKLPAEPPGLDDKGGWKPK